MSILPYLLFLLLAQQPGRAESGTLSGQLREGSGAPAAGVRIAAAPIETGVAIGTAPATLTNITQTDSQGRYRLENVLPGRYMIMAGMVSAPTYYPGGTTPDPGRSVTVAAGQAVTDLNFVLMPPKAANAGIAGIVYAIRQTEADCKDSVTGFVRTDDGSPLFTSSVSTVQIGINGESVNLVSRLSCRNFNIGVFRGDLRAGANKITVAQLPLGLYLKSMTAGNVDLTRAPLIASASLSGAQIEVVLSRNSPTGMPQGVEIGGRVTNVELPLDSRFDLVLAGVPAMAPPDRIAPTDVLIRRIDGTFEAQNVVPGRYTLRTGGSVLGTFDVGGSDVTNLNLKFEPPAKVVKPETPVPLNPNSMRSIRGTVEVRDGATPEFEIGFVPTRAGGETHIATISRGEFSILLPEGEYRVRISGLPTSYSVKSVLVGPLDLTEPFLVTSKGIADRFTGSPVRIPSEGTGITVRLTAPPEK